MIRLLTSAYVYDPAPVGIKDVLFINDSIIRVGDLDESALRKTGLEIDVIDCTDCVITPGFIDPHQHLLGGSGEEGFASQTPELAMNEIITGGITTVVGCLGTDTITKTPHGLLAKVKALKEEGLNAFMWTGGYTYPPATITSNLRTDMVFVDEVIGLGELAVADERSSEPTVAELARLASDTATAGKLSNKAGRIHVHVGSQESRLKLIRECIERCGCPAEWFYITHINRSAELFREAIELAKAGAFIDVDVVDGGMSEHLEFNRANGGITSQLTVSSDASITSPQDIYSQVKNRVIDRGMPLETVLPHVTLNTSNALKLPVKGGIREGCVADILVLSKNDLSLRFLFSKGRMLIKDSEPTTKEKFLENSDRRIVLEGQGHEREPTNITAANA